MGAAIQGKARRGSDSGLTLPWPRWWDWCSSAEQHPLQGSWGWGGGTQLSVQPFLSRRRCQGFWKGQEGRQAAPSLVWVFAKGTVGNTNSLKAEGLQPLLKVTPSQSLTHILSTWRSHLGYTLLNSCQVSHPLAGDTLVPLQGRSAAPPQPALPPALAARQQDQVAAEAALCQAAPAAGGLGCPPQGHCRDKEGTPWCKVLSWCH